MRRVVAVAVALVCAFVVVRRASVAPIGASRSAPPAAAAPAVPSIASPPTVAGNETIGRAFASHAQDVAVDGAGVVSRLLSDDTRGDRHQRFLVRLPSGQTILIAHNIDVAPRVANLRVGDDIEFQGEYVWNAQGGLVHWTHRDPAGRHMAGWVRYRGRTYQ
jgi:hypothetical protein